MWWVQNGTLSPEEQAYYVRRVTEKFPRGVVEKVVLDVGEEYVDIRYTLHCFRDLRKMGGYCIGDPADWNPAKQAELRDTVPILAPEPVERLSIPGIFGRMLSKLLMAG